MRTTWKRAVVGLLIAGVVGGAALGLARPGDPPTVIPHADDPPPPDAAPVVQAQATVPSQRNDAAVALEWSGPAVVKANQPTEYTLNVRNVCGQPLQKVVLQVRALKGTEITTVKPEVKPTDGVYLWELGTLDAKATQSVTVTLKQPAKGDMTCQAWVTLTGTSAMKAVVKEPKLAVAMKVPEKVAVGDKFVVEYTVTNTGDIPAEDVVAKLHMDSTCIYNFNSVDASPPCLLKPGESKTLKVEHTTTAAGVQKCEVKAVGADGVSGRAEATVQVLAPKIDVSISGSKERLIGTKGKYIVTVKNTGEIAVGGVAVQQSIPTGFKVATTGPGKMADDKLIWSAGDLAPGASKQFEFEGVTHTAGPLTLKAVASGDRKAFASGECVTQVEGIPGLRMELVDSVDPVEKNGEVTYEIKVTNTGTKADSNVVIVCNVPKQLEFVSCSGPTKGQLCPGVTLTSYPPQQGPPSVVFDAISDLAPKTEAVFKVKVKGVGTGDVRFTATMTSKHLTAPVKKEESTRVYGE